jgi:hypothetical protein
MKLKCVGGSNDGEYGYTYDDKPRVGEHVRMRIPKQFVPRYDNILPSLDESRIAMLDTIIIYIVDIAGYRTDGKETLRFEYLRWEGITRDEIMIKLLTDFFL